MSALGHKRSFSPDLPNVRFAPTADIQALRRAVSGAAIAVWFLLGRPGLTAGPRR